MKNDGDDFITITPEGEVNIDLEKRYEGMPVQHAFIKDNRKHTYLFGGFGNGKTDCLVIKALKLAFKYPKALGLIGRASYPELRDSTLRSFFDLCPLELIKNFNKQEGVMELINGANILFKAFDKPYKVKSINLGWAGFDQLEDIPYETWLHFLGRLRSDQCQMMFGVGNPESNWIVEKIKDNQSPEFKMYEAPSQSNPHLPEGYIQTMIEQYPKHWVKRFIFGSWDHFASQVLNEFIESKHVIEPFTIPPSWEASAEYVIDYGFRNLTFVIKVLRDFDGNHFIVGEHAESEQVVTYHRKKIYELGYTPKHIAYIDPSTRARNRVKNETQISIIDEFTDTDYPYPVYPIPANNDISGYNRLNEWFKQDKLKIFRSCPQLIRQIKGLRWKKVRADWDQNMPEKEEDRDNDGTDCLKYYANSRPPDVPLPTDKLNPLRNRYLKLTRGKNVRVI